MAADPRLANLPALRKLAEEEARHIWSVNQRLFRHAGWDVVADPNDPGAFDGFEITVAAQIEIMADFTRPASMDAVLRLVAEALGLACRTSAPILTQTGRMWSIWNGVDVAHLFVADLRGGWNGLGVDTRHRLSAIGGVTDPAEALTLIALHVLGSPDAHR